MGQLRMADTMDKIAATLKAMGISRAYAWPVESFNPPAAVVAYPEEIRYDNTKMMGTDDTQFQVFVVLGKVADRQARDAMTAYADPNSTKSVKTALDGDLDGLVTKCWVSAARPATTLDGGGVPYLAVEFDVHVIS